MHKRITFRNMVHSDAMEAYTNKQLEKIEQFLKREPTPISIDIVIEASKVHEHPRVECRIKTPHFDEVSHCEHEGVDIYNAIDRVLDVMYRKLLEHKQKKVDKRKMRGRHDDFKKQR